MFIYKLSSWVDRFDPYWYSRLMGLKALYITLVLFMANLILHPPLASLVMLIAGAGVLLVEMPTINNLAKKDKVYLGYIILMCLTIALFSSAVYLRGAFIVVAAAWCYILYTALKKMPQLFPMVSLILMLGIMSLEGVNSGNFYVILNILMFILEFSLIAFWAHKFFPNLYHLLWLSATLRTLESLRQMLHHGSSNSQAFSHNLVARQLRDLLRPKAYLRAALTFSNQLGYYHYYVTDLLENQSRVVAAPIIALIEADLYRLEQAIRCRQPLLGVAEYRQIQRSVVTPANCGSAEGNAAATPDNARPHYQLYAQLGRNWNKICANN